MHDPSQDPARPSPTDRALAERLFGEVMTMTEIVQQLADRGDFERARDLLDRIPSVVRHLPAGRLKDLTTAAHTEMTGLFLAMVGEHAQAVEKFAQAASQFSDAAHLPGVYSALAHEGLSLRDAGRIHEAVAAFRKAAELDRIHGLEESIPRKYALQLSLASVQASGGAGAGGRVVEQIDEALAWIPPVKCPKLTALLLLRGNACMVAGRFEDALGSYQEAVVSARANGETAMEARLTDRIAQCRRAAS